MDVIERGHTSLRKVNMYWNILFTSLSNHSNGRTRSRKVGPQGVLIEVEDETIISWVLNMQKVNLFVTLQQFKLKVVEVTLTKSTPFKMVFMEATSDIS
jgi:hypothetical protein